MSDYFFGPRFLEDLHWQGTTPLQVGSIQPHNKKQISAALKDLSSASIRNRFMGSKRDFTPEELVYLSHLDGQNHYALGILEKTPHGRGVAVVRLVRSSSETTEAEVALTIIDEYQRKGLGTLLLGLIVLAAHEREIERLSFTFLRDNEGIGRLLRRLGARPTERTSGETVRSVLEVRDSEIPRLIGELRPNLPRIDEFRSKI